MSQKKKTVIVAMSGGVDSSVAALLMLEQSYNVIGVHMRLGDNKQKAEAAARAVCNKLGIKYYPTNVSHAFKMEVIDYFVRNYQDGFTPNPCVRCNKTIKFGVLLRLLKVMKAEYFATGHYVANVKCRMTPPSAKATEGKNVESKFKLYRGKDKTKDQSYFLYTMTQERLKNILFPLGDYKKTEVRKIADKAGLPYLKSESQDICFLMEDGKILEHNEFLKAHIELKPGPIKTLGGKRVGEHQGLPLYTIGQRRGVEIGGTGPYYVAKRDKKTNTLYVVSDENDPALFSDEFVINHVNWVSGKEPKLPFKCETVIRYRHKAVECEVGRKSSNLPAGDWNSGARYTVKLEKPERAVTPGQSAVFYQGDEVMGGGIIYLSKSV